MKLKFVAIASSVLTGLLFFAGTSGDNDSPKSSADVVATSVQPILNPKYELRAAWVTTFTNLDWPSKKGLPENEQKQEFIRLLDELQMNKINCVIVQVRAAGDAFYPSKFAPWSEYLMGKQGLAPNYDPLKFMVEQCHQRNMEFHAWLNPFRAVSSTQFSSVSSDNLYNKHPEWFFKYGSSIYFNPGVKEARQHILNVVGEIVNNYDVDAIHFDDYFYPYTIEGEYINDATLYKKFGSQYSSIHDWRRSNINELVKDVSSLVKFTKPYVKFGISPLAFWRNKNQDPQGSETQSAQTSYDNLYCDTRKWLQKGWVDYIVPQLYWSRKSPHASYKNLLNWWTSHDYKGHIYIGQALFRLEDDSKQGFRVNELMEQIKLNRMESDVQGNIFFRAKTFRNNAQNIQDSLQSSLYKYPALIPPMKWIDSIPPSAPKQLKIKVSEDGALLKWKEPDMKEENDGAYYYVIYRFAKNEAVNIFSAKNITAIVRHPMYFDPGKNKGDFRYVVTAVDRLHNESAEYAIEE
ncbi:MAG: glycoside hydrolase family 10 protein [Flavobacteriales bacterium]